MMKADIKGILSVASVAALLASPAMAKQMRPEKLLAIPSDTRALVAPYGESEGGPYTPSIPTSRYGQSRDFQSGGGNK